MGHPDSCAEANYRRLRIHTCVKHVGDGDHGHGILPLAPIVFDRHFVAPAPEHGMCPLECVPGCNV